MLAQGIWTWTLKSYNYMCIRKGGIWGLIEIQFYVRARNLYHSNSKKSDPLVTFKNIKYHNSILSIKYSQLLYFEIHMNNVNHMILSQKPLSGATVDWFCAGKAPQSKGAI